MNKTIAYIDGKAVHVGQGVIDSFTPGVFQGRGVFETLKVDATGVYDAKAHWQRLNQGLKALKMVNPKPYRVWEQGMQDIVSRSNLVLSQDKSMRLRWMVWQQKACVHWAILALSYQPPTKKQYKQGLKVCVIATNRQAHARLAMVKSLDYGLFANALSRAKAKGFDDALLVNKKGHIFESTRANVFVIINDMIITPPLSSGCLNGIMRQQMIAMMKKVGTPVYEKNITPAMLRKASAVMLSNSLMGYIKVDLKSLQTVLAQ